MSVAVVAGQAGAGGSEPGGDGVLPGLEVGGVWAGEFSEPGAGGAGERGQLVGDLDLDLTSLWWPAALMVMVTVPACSPGVTRAQQMRLPGWRPVTT